MKIRNAYIRILRKMASYDPYERCRYLASILSRELYTKIRGGPLLDVGCGDKSIANILKEKHNVDIVGLDIKRTRPDVIGDACYLPFMNKSFQAVMLITVLEYVPKHLRPLALSEAKRVLKHRGILIVYVPNKTFPIGQDSFIPFVNFAPTSVRQFIVGHYVDLPSRTELLRDLSAAGFKLISESQLYHEYLSAITRKLTAYLPIARLFVAVNNLPN